MEIHSESPPVPVTPPPPPPVVSGSSDNQLKIGDLDRPQLYRMTGQRLYLIVSQFPRKKRRNNKNMREKSLKNFFSL